MEIGISSIFLVVINEQDIEKITFLESCPIGTCGPLLERRANLIICRFTKINKRINVKIPPAMKTTTVIWLNHMTLTLKLHEKQHEERIYLNTLNSQNDLDLILKALIRGDQTCEYVFRTYFFYINWNQIGISLIDQNVKKTYC